MDKKALLNKLEGFYNIPAVRDGFSTREDCLEWANSVAPLLKFNPQYYANFLSNSHKLNLPLSAATLGPALTVMASQVKMAIEELKMLIELEPPNEAARPGEKPYIDETRIKELEEISNSSFDLAKLIQILRELNVCHRYRCNFAVITLTRTIIDHVPPIFKCKTFAEVANNYSGSKSFKGSMKHLQDSCRNIADQHLHCQIRQKEVLPNQTQGNFSNDIDVLLSEIVRLLR